METTTSTRRIARSINRHARCVATRNASGGGMIVYFDLSGREVYHHPAGEIAPFGKDLCPWGYATKRTVRWQQIVTYSDVADSPDLDPKGVLA